MYRCVIFDMDGTLINSYEGIYHAYEWTMRKMNRKFGGEAFVRRAIGAPLPVAFRELAGMNAAETELAVSYYRGYYDEKGKRQAALYDGMEESLRRLCEAGCFIGVATMKKERFAKEILDHLQVRRYFDAVCGADEEDRFTKSDLIERCLQTYARKRIEDGSDEKALEAARREAILVGDTVYDAEGAAQAGIDFLAVTYGFGFREPGALRKVRQAAAVAAPRQIAERILAQRMTG